MHETSEGDESLWRWVASVCEERCQTCVILFGFLNPGMLDMLPGGTTDITCVADDSGVFVERKVGGFQSVFSILVKKQMAVIGQVGKA